LPSPGRPGSTSPAWVVGDVLPGRPGEGNTAEVAPDAAVIEVERPPRRAAPPAPGAGAGAAAAASSA